MLALTSPSSGRTVYKERNDLLREIGDLKRTIAELTAEVRPLKKKLD